MKIKITKPLATTKPAPQLLSKSKLIAHRQCPKRMWLEIYAPKLKNDSTATQAIFQTGHVVGEIAQKIYAPRGDGTVINLSELGVDLAIATTRNLMSVSDGRTRRPVFEAGFGAAGCLAFADVLMPTQQRKFESQNVAGRAWRMVEVKSSASVKDYHLEDVAIQTYVARLAAQKQGWHLTGVSLAHIDTSFTYQGNNQYKGLLHEVDLTDESFARGDEVKVWIKAAHATAQSQSEPDVRMGTQCSTPFPCGFASHCQSQTSPVVLPEFPITWIPDRRAKNLKNWAENNPQGDMRDVPDLYLNDKQRLVRDYTLRKKKYFDAAGALSDLKRQGALQLPVYFLDFETTQFAAPIWIGTHPFEKCMFQFSVHKLDSQEKLTQKQYLHLSYQDPKAQGAMALVEACGRKGSVMVYNMGFEGSVIRAMATRFRNTYPKLASDLLAIEARLVDLLPMAKERYYAPSLEGSWSIKKVYPSLPGCHNKGHAALEGVQASGEAPLAYAEACGLQITEARFAEIKEQLLAYCRLDTLATVHLWAYFANRKDLMRLS